ncbi:MAG: pyruvate, phosphate dikinase, partial [Fibrobacter sp.]|nr:pyruvate, phosphate dikinase [Fibrobacter sp.]
YTTLMEICDKVSTLKIRANADTPRDARKAIEFGAQGIGLFRTEHMFYGEGSDEPLFLLRKMIMSTTLEERKAALDQLSVFVKRDIKATMEALNGLPLTIRLLDPPLHEFVPHSEDKIATLAAELGINVEDAKKRGESLKENNPMLGHRGVRLGITYPEVSEMQLRSILEAAGELILEGKEAFPEIMIPVTVSANELKNQRKLLDAVYADVCTRLGLKKIPFTFGSMIEIPRAAFGADKMAEVAEFFSFGTNDLTQMFFGFSRDDIGSFLPDYLAAKILPADPFQTIDQEVLGELMKMSIERGRETRPGLKVGICGEHGGDPESVKFCHRIGMNYVSCSPFRVPIARLAAAQAAVEEKSLVRKPSVKKAKKTASVLPAVRKAAKTAPAKAKSTSTGKAPSKKVKKAAAPVKASAKKVKKAAAPVKASAKKTKRSAAPVKTLAKKVKKGAVPVKKANKAIAPAKKKVAPAAKKATKKVAKKRK